MGPVGMEGFLPARCVDRAAIMKLGVVRRRIVRVVDLIFAEPMQGVAKGPEERKLSGDLGAMRLGNVSTSHVSTF